MRINRILGDTSSYMIHKLEELELVPESGQVYTFYPNADFDILNSILARLLNAGLDVEIVNVIAYNGNLNLWVYPPKINPNTGSKY